MKKWNYIIIFCLTVGICVFYIYFLVSASANHIWKWKLVISWHTYYHIWKYLGNISQTYKNGTSTIFMKGKTVYSMNFLYFINFHQQQREISSHVLRHTESVAGKFKYYPQNVIHIVTYGAKKNLYYIYFVKNWLQYIPTAKSFTQYFATAPDMELKNMLLQI